MCLKHMLGGDLCLEEVSDAYGLLPLLFYKPQQEYQGKNKMLNALF